MPDTQLLVDISGVSPTCSSYIDKSSKTPLAIALMRERNKKNKYESIATKHNIEVVPFIFETYGGIAPQAIQLLKKLNSYYLTNHPCESAQHFFFSTLSKISVAIQRHNAVMIRNSFLRSRTQEHFDDHCDA